MIKQKYNTFYSSSKAKKITNESDINDVFESIYSMIISDIIGKGSNWIIDSVLDHNINKLFRSNSYIKFPKELNYPKKT